MNTAVSLQTAPPELLAKIFTHACNDTGYTGYALNLTCKTFHEVCVDTAVDIQSASVCGPRKMEQFLEVLRRRGETKRKVVSLFLSYRAGAGWLDEDFHNNVVSIETRTATVELMLDIMRTVSPVHLKVLHVDFPYVWVPSAFVHPIPLPSLVELRLTGRVWANHLSDLHDVLAVKKLCLSGPFLYCRRHDEERKESLGAMIKRACPRLTHLRFKPPMSSPPIGEVHFDLVHSYCLVTRSARDIIKTPPLLDAGDGAIEGQATHFVPVGDDTQPNIPAQLHRIIIESPPYTFSPGGAKPAVIGTAFRRPSPDELWRTSRHTIYEAYQALAMEAKRESGIGEEENPERRSLIILPLLPDLRKEDRRHFALEEFVQLKAEWLEITSGTGPGCWV